MMGEVVHLDLFAWKPPAFAADHDGATYDSKRDKLRLNLQLSLVYEVMKDGQWRTLGRIREATGAPEASISARLRDLRKPEHHQGLVDRVERRYVERGLFEYRVVIT